VAMVAACYSPQPSPGAPCGPGDTCPEDLTCSNGLCLAEPGTADSSAADSAPVDGPLPDVAPVRWALIATAGETNPVTDIDPTSAGNTILVGVETEAATGATAVTDDAGNAYTLIANSRAVNPGRDFGVEIWLAQDSAAGATKVTATGPVIHAVVVWEVAGIASEAPIVEVETRDAQAASNTPPGAPVTTTETGQFVLSIAIVANFVSGLTADSDFANDHTTFGNGWAHLRDNDAPPGMYMAQWNQQTTGTSCASSVVLRTGP